MPDRYPTADLDALAREARAARRAWGKLEDLGGLVGVPEIAERWGITQQAVRNYRDRQASFPDPIITAAGTSLWLAADIDLWRATPRRRGRPPKHLKD